MNVIVSNKQKNILDNANIDAIKDLNGLFNVDELINNFNGYFFSKIIIDATSIIDFAKEDTLKKLVSGFGSDKIILLLPETPEPPKKFCEFLESLGIYSYSTNISKVVEFLKKVNNNESLNSSNNQNFYSDSNETSPSSENSTNSFVESGVSQFNEVNNINNNKKIVIGFKNITFHAGSTTLIYMIKQCLEKKYKIPVEAFELGNGDFKFFNSSNMVDININNLGSVIENSKSSVILLDVNGVNCDEFCDEIIYLIEPSILKINKLLFINGDVFNTLNSKKVILNKSMITQEEVLIFAKEAGIDVYYSIPYVNDRIENKVIEDFIDKLGIVNKGGQGLFGLFNR